MGRGAERWGFELHIGGVWLGVGSPGWAGEREWSFPPAPSGLTLGCTGGEQALPMPQ